MTANFKPNYATVSSAAKTFSICKPYIYKLAARGKVRMSKAAGNKKAVNVNDLAAALGR